MTATTTTWLATLRALCDDSLDTDEQVALRALEMLSRDDLVQILAREVQHIRRMSMHDLERCVAAGLGRSHDGSANADARESTTAQFVDLYGNVIALGDGKRVLFEDATVEQHLQRIVMLERMRNGIETTIALHRQAVAVIVEAGTTCLREV